jgi:hypothetical protein
VRPALEVADIFHRHGAAWRAGHAGHLSLAQLKVMSAIETCRTAALGGHVEGCEACGFTRIAYNSCRNRHCPKCQGAAAREWLAAREADLLPVGYFHVVFTVPAKVADIAFHNKAVVYDLLFRAASQTMLTIAADPHHLGASIGITAVLHTWGSAMTHHPHIHMIVPGGGISLDGEHWIPSRPAFLLPVRVLSKLFRRLFLTGLLGLHATGRLAFFGDHAGMSDQRTFLRHLAPLRSKRWVVYAKPPFAGPEAVLALRAPDAAREVTASGQFEPDSSPPICGLVAPPVGGAWLTRASMARRDAYCQLAAALTQRYRSTDPKALPFGGGDLVADALADHLAFELGEGQKHIEGKPFPCSRWC